jgi:hypothetical protein
MKFMVTFNSTQGAYFSKRHASGWTPYFLPSPSSSSYPSEGESEIMEIGCERMPEIVMSMVNKYPKTWKSATAGRTKMSKLVLENMQVVPAVKQSVDEFWFSKVRPSGSDIRVLGIHMRGGDIRHQKVPADEYFVLARAYIQHNTKLGLKTRIFLAADDQTYISTLPSELKELIVQQPDVLRTGQGGEMKARNAYGWTGQRSGSGFSDRPRGVLGVFASLDRL